MKDLRCNGGLWARWEVQANHSEHSEVQHTCMLILEKIVGVCQRACVVHTLSSGKMCVRERVRVSACGSPTIFTEFRLTSLAW